MDLLTTLAAGAAGAADTVIVVPVGLGAIGFTSAGIAPGSIAAGMMSTAAIDNGGGVAAGSPVAILQSAGMAAGAAAKCAAALIVAIV
ncbi:interferon alpha-inducible protein 27-like protein 1 [Syngnathus typhle]